MYGEFHGANFSSLPALMSNLTASTFPHILAMCKPVVHEKVNSEAIVPP